MGTNTHIFEENAVVTLRLFRDTNDKSFAYA
jgi:hypothetical protein